MITDEQEPATAPRRHRNRRGWLPRFNDAWRRSAAYALVWRFRNWCYEIWHPRGREAGSRSYGPRRKSLPHQLLRKITAPFRRTHAALRAGIFDPLSRWWFPAREASSRGYGSGRRRSRPALAWQKWRSWLSRTRLSIGVATLRHRFFEWWNPIESSGDYGRGRRSRLGSAASRMRRGLAASWLGRAHGRMTFRLYEWWYPATAGRDGYSGGGHRGRSRPALFLAKVQRGISHSRLGRGVAGFGYAAHEWWYPPFDSGARRGGHYQYRRVSRPVVYYRRWRGWLRGTWVGREFGWVIDEVADGLWHARRAMVRRLDWYRIERVATRPATMVIFLALIGGAVVLHYYVRPGYHRYLERQYTMQARLFLERGELERAALRARQAIQENYESADAAAVIAEVSDRERSPGALHWRSRAAALAPTPSNRLALARTALRVEEFPYSTASRELRDLAPVMETNGLYQALRGSLAAKTGDLRAAERAFSLAVASNPGDTGARASLAALRLRSGDSEAESAARAVLRELATDDEAGLSALRSLAADAFNRKDYALAGQLSSKVLAHRDSKISDGLLHASVLLAQGDTNFPSYLGDLKNRAMQSPAAVGEVAAWMNQSGLAVEARLFLEEVLEKAPNQTLLRVALADSFAALKDWGGLEQWLEKERWPGMEYLRFAMMARAMRNQSGGARYQVAWTRAVSGAGQFPAAMNSLAKVAASWGWDVETEQVLWAAAGRYRTERWPLDALKQHFAGRKDTIGLRRTFQEMAARDPSDKLAKNNFASLSLLMKKDIPAACAIAGELYQGAPENPIFAFTQAFALHVQGRTEEGLAVLGKLPESRRQVPALALYEGVMLAAAGRREDAGPLLETAAKGFLLPEEDTLLKAALSGAKTRSTP